MSSTRKSLLDALRAVLADHPLVRLAVLFGSQATGRSHPASDVDVGFLAAGKPSLHDELMLLAEVERAAGRPVDLVSLDGAPTLVRWYAARDGVAIWAATECEWSRFRAAAASEHADFAPALERAARRYRHRLAVGRPA